MKYPLLNKILPLLAAPVWLFVAIQGVFYGDAISGNLFIFMTWLGLFGAFLGLFMDVKYPELPKWVSAWRFLCGVLTVLVLAAGGWFATAVALILTWVFREASKSGPVISVEAKVEKT